MKYLRKLQENKMYKNLTFTILAISLLLMTSCSGLVSISPSTTPITEKDTYTKLGYAVGRSYGVLIFFFIPIFSKNPSKNARDSAIKSGGGNALIEVVEETNMLTLILVNIYWTTVEGTAIQLEHKGRIIE